MKMALGLPVLQGSNGFFAQDAVNRALVEGDRTVRHLEVTLPEGQTYQAGDHLGVYGFSPLSVELQQLATRTLAKYLAGKAEGASKAMLEELADLDKTVYDEHVVKGRRTLLELLKIPRDRHPVRGVARHPSSQ